VEEKRFPPRLRRSERWARGFALGVIGALLGLAVPGAPAGPLARPSMALLAAADPQVDGDPASAAAADPQPFPGLAALWDFSAPGATEMRLRNWRRRARADGDTLLAFELQTQIARCRGLQGDFEGGHALLDSLAGDLDAAGPRARVRFELERGRLYNSNGDAAAAAAHFTRAWEMARTAGETCLAIDAAHMLGIVLPPTEQEAWHRRAIAVALPSSLPCARRWLGPLYNNLGWTLLERGEVAAALELFEQDWNLRRELEARVPARIARWNMGHALRLLGRIEEALGIQRALASAWEADGEPDGYVYEEIAECLLARGQVAEARPHCARAFELLSRDAWLQEHEPERLERLERLSRSDGLTGAP